MSAQDISAAVAELDAQLALAREQAMAGLRAGIQAAAEHQPMPQGMRGEDSYWAAGYVAGYEAVAH